MSSLYDSQFAQLIIPYHQLYVADFLISEFLNPLCGK